MTTTDTPRFEAKSHQGHPAGWGVWDSKHGEFITTGWTKFEAMTLAEYSNGNATAQDTAWQDAYRGLSDDQLNTLLSYTLADRSRDPNKFANLRVVAVERGLMKPEPVGNAARGEAFLAKTFPTKPEPFAW